MSLTKEFLQEVEEAEICICDRCGDQFEYSEMMKISAGDESALFCLNCYEELT